MQTENVWLKFLAYEEDVGPALLSNASIRSEAQMIDLTVKKLRKDLQDHEVEPFHNQFSSKSVEGAAPRSITSFLKKTSPRN